MEEGAARFCFWNNTSNTFIVRHSTFVVFTFFHGRTLDADDFAVAAGGGE